MLHKQPPQEKQFYKTALASIITAGAYYHAVQELLQLSKENKYLIKIKDAPQIQPKGLKEQFIKEHGDQESSIEKKLVLLDGFVGCSEPIASEIKNVWKQKKLIYRLSFKEEIYSLKKWDEKENSQLNLVQRIPENFLSEQVPSFYVQSSRDPDTNSPKVEVHFLSDCDVKNSLQIIGQAEKTRRLTVSEYFLNLLLMLSKLLLQVTANPMYSSIRGYNIGVREYELGIEVGSPVKVLGEVTYNFNTGEMVIEMPRMILNNKDALIRALEKGIEKTTVNCYFWGAVALCGTLYLARRAFVYQRNKKNLALKEKEQEQQQREQQEQQQREYQARFNSQYTSSPARHNSGSLPE